MPSITAENRKRIAEMLEQSMPADQVAKKLRSRGVQLQTVLEMERDFKAKNPKASTERTPVVTINPNLMKRLAELVGAHGFDQVADTLGHVREIGRLVSGTHTTPLDVPEYADDEAAISHELAASRINGAIESAEATA